MAHDLFPGPIQQFRGKRGNNQEHQWRNGGKYLKKIVINTKVRWILLPDASRMRFRCRRDITPKTRCQRRQSQRRKKSSNTEITSKTELMVNPCSRTSRGRFSRCFALRRATSEYQATQVFNAPSALSRRVFPFCLRKFQRRMAARARVGSKYSITFHA